MSLVYNESIEMEDFLKKIRETIMQKGTLYMKIKVTPGAQKTRFMSLLEGEDVTLKIAVAAAPEKGKANQEIVRFLSDYFACEVVIISGHASSSKLLQLKKKAVIQ